MQINYDEIDANMHKLVGALNQIEGVRTFSSCGGHENPKPGQVATGQWYVCMELDLSTDALPILVWAVGYLRVWHTIQFYPVMLTDEYAPDCIDWQLDGSDLNPDEVATQILTTIH